MLKGEMANLVKFLVKQHRTLLQEVDTRTVLGQKALLLKQVYEVEGTFLLQG